MEWLIPIRNPVLRWAVITVLLVVWVSCMDIRPAPAAEPEPAWCESETLAVGCFSARVCFLPDTLDVLCCRRSAWGLHRAECNHRERFRDAASATCPTGWRVLGTYCELPERPPAKPATPEADA